MYINTFSLLWFKLQSESLAQKVLRSDQINAIVELIAGFIMDEVINSNGEHYYNPKEITMPNDDED